MSESFSLPLAALADLPRRELTADFHRGEVATIQQVADAVRYLACDASGSVNGSILRVDGGWTAR